VIFVFLILLSLYVMDYKFAIVIIVADLMIDETLLA
jgi:hypothetical protein